MAPIKLLCSPEPVLSLPEAWLTDTTIPLLDPNGDVSLLCPKSGEHSLLFWFCMGTLTGLVLTFVIILFRAALFPRLRGTGPGEQDLGRVPGGPARRNRRSLRPFLIEGSDVHQRNVTGVQVENSEEARINWEDRNPWFLDQDLVRTPTRLSPRKHRTKKSQNENKQAQDNTKQPRIITPQIATTQLQPISTEPLTTQFHSITGTKPQPVTPQPLTTQFHSITGTKPRPVTPQPQKITFSAQPGPDSDFSPEGPFNSIRIPKSKSRAGITELSPLITSPLSTSTAFGTFGTFKSSNDTVDRHIPKSKSRPGLTEQSPLITSSPSTSTAFGTFKPYNNMADRKNTDRSSRKPDLYQISEATKEELRKVTVKKPSGWTSYIPGLYAAEPPPTTGYFNTKGFMNADGSPHIWMSRRTGEEQIYEEDIIGKGPAVDDGPQVCEACRKGKGPAVDKLTGEKPVCQVCTKGKGPAGDDGLRQTRTGEEQAYRVDRKGKGPAGDGSPHDTEYEADQSKQSSISSPLETPQLVKGPPLSGYEGKGLTAAELDVVSSLPLRSVYCNSSSDQESPNSSTESAKKGPMLFAVPGRSLYDYRGRLRKPVQTQPEPAWNGEGTVTSAQLAKSMPQWFWDNYGSDSDGEEPYVSDEEYIDSDEEVNNTDQAQAEFTPFSQKDKQKKDVKDKATKAPSTPRVAEDEDYFRNVQAFQAYCDRPRPDKKARNQIVTSPLPIISPVRKMPPTPSRIPSIISPTPAYPVRGLSFTSKEPVPFLALPQGRGTSASSGGSVLYTPFDDSPKKTVGLGVTMEDGNESD